MALLRSSSWYAALWYCLLGSGAIAAPSTDITPNVLYYNTANTTQGSAFLKNLNDVLGYLAKNTPLTNSSSRSSGSYPDTAYGLAECYNMSQSGCGQCFNIIAGHFRTTCPLALGAQEYVNGTPYSCFVRYENYNFLGSPPPAAAPPKSSPGTAVPPNNVASAGKGSNSNRSKIILGTVTPLVALSFAALGAYFMLCKRKRNRKRKLGNSQTHDEDDVEGNLQITRAYTYEELRAATEDFAENNKLGHGAFGTVYRGTLRDGRQVAVKKLLLVSHRGNDDFVNEVNIISSIRHRNLVRLEGYCLEGQQRMLVLEYVVNGNLGNALFRKSIELDWPSRYDIIMGIARGLAYLHEESHIQIIHRDIKTGNVLLDSKLEPKIADFGISKLFDRDRESTTSSGVAGTYGYLAPEYAIRGRLTAKADVFSFGVLVLEIVSGRRASDPSLAEEEELIIEWAWKLYSDGILETLIDPALELTTSTAAWKVQALRSLNIALLCTQLDANSRPTMSQVVAMLLDYLAVPCPPRSESPTYFGRMTRLRERESSTTGSNITRSTAGQQSSVSSEGSFGPR